MGGPHHARRHQKRVQSGAGKRSTKTKQYIETQMGGCQAASSLTYFPSPISPLRFV